MSYLKRDCFDKTNTTPGASEDGYSFSGVFLSVALITVIAIFVCCLCGHYCTEVYNCFERCFELGVKTCSKYSSKPEDVTGGKQEDVTIGEELKPLSVHFAFKQEDAINDGKSNYLSTHESTSLLIGNNQLADHVVDSNIEGVIY